MKMNPVHTGRRTTASVLSLIVLAVALSVLAQRAAAQAPPASSGAADAGMYQTIYLTNVTEKHDAQDVITDLRNMLPRARLYYVESQNAISIHGSADEIQTAQKILADIDRPRKVYRLTYSLTEIDGDKTVDAQKVSLIAIEGGERAVLKQGGKLPIITGTTEAGGSAQNSQVQYIDTGLTIEAAVEGSADALRLSTKIEQSSIADQRAASGVPDPTFRHTGIEAVAALVPGKPLVLGSLDIPGTTRREEVSVVSELVR
jgi:type II secretory pathway component GspD/PulD (secretin)